MEAQDLFCQFFVDQYNAWIELPGYFYVRPDRLTIAEFDTKTPTRGSMTIRTPTPRKAAIRKPARKSGRWLR